MTSDDKSTHESTHESTQRSAPTSCRVFWDYHGPTAHQTALHFQRHLETWLERAVREQTHEDARGASLIGTEAYSPTHSAVYCVLPLKFGEQVYRALRAHRAIHERDS